MTSVETAGKVVDDAITAKKDKEAKMAEEAKKKEVKAKADARPTVIRRRPLRPTRRLSGSCRRPKGRTRRHERGSPGGGQVEKGEIHTKETSEPYYPGEQQHHTAGIVGKGRA